MQLSRIQVLSLILVLGMVAVPSLAFPGNTQTRCYKSELTEAGTVYGYVKLMNDPSGAQLEVEVEGYTPGQYEVTLFKDYYSDIVIGTLVVGQNGDGKGTYSCPLQDPDFTVYIKDGVNTLTSGDWVECEHPQTLKVSPSTLNLKSNGNWVTIKIATTNPLPEGFVLSVNGAPVEYNIINDSPNHIVVKVQRSDLQALCSTGINTITLSYMSGDETQTYSDTFKVINQGSTHSTTQSAPKVKTNNGKAYGKNKYE